MDIWREGIVTAIPSTQSTDVQINRVTEKLFQKYRNVENYARANLRVLEIDIYSTGFLQKQSKEYPGCFQDVARLILECYWKSFRNHEKLVALPWVEEKPQI